MNRDDCRTGLGPDADEDDDTAFGAYMENAMERCGCQYCHCVVETEYGEVCSFCRSGAHQG